MLAATRIVEIEFDAGVWTNVTADVRVTTTHRGRSSESDQFSAGTATVTLKNANRKYDPEHATGTYYGKLLPRKRIRIGFIYSGTTYYKFYGSIDRWSQSYDGPNWSDATVTASDAFKVLARAHVPSVYETVMRPLGPLSWWRLGEESGTTLFDSSGNGYHGTYTTDVSENHRPGLLTAASDGAAAFTTDTDQQAVIPDAGPTAFPFTVTGWFLATAGEGRIMWFRHPEDGPTGSLSAYVQTAGTGVLDNIFVGVHGPGDDKYVWQTQDEFADGIPHFVAVVLRDSNDIDIYVDGFAVLIATFSSSGPTPTLPAASEQVIAKFDTLRDVVYDEIAVFDYALSASEIEDLWNAGSTAWADDTPKARIDRILDYIGWPAGDRDLDTGSAVLLPATLETSALSHLQDVELSEGGRLFIDRTGRVALIGRSNFWSEAVYKTSNATFGDGAGELRYRMVPDELFTLDDDKIVNEARVSQVDGTEQVYADATSQTTYGLMTRSESTLESRPAVVLNRAEYLVGRYKDPLARMPQVTIKPEKAPASLYALLGANDLGYRYTFKRRPQNVGSAISKDFHVESETLTMTAEDITVEWELSPGETGWVWGDNWPITWSY